MKHTKPISKPFKFGWTNSEILAECPALMERAYNRFKAGKKGWAWRPGMGDNKLPNNLDITQQ